MSERTFVRRIGKIVKAREQREGAGFVVQRLFPGAPLKDSDIDPFLMLDEFGPVPADPRSPGAPWHPHRGFDTVMYIKSGCGAHSDSMGNKGLIKAGEVQWMRAGAGVIHDETPPKGMPEEEYYSYGKEMHGFQLWVNLPPELKMSPPAYHQLTADTFHWVPIDSRTQVKVIAGEVSGPAGSSKSPLALSIPILYVDIVSTSSAEPQLTKITIPPELDTCMLYVYEGEGRIFDGESDEAGTAIKAREMAMFLEGASNAATSVVFIATAPRGLKALLLAGKKIKAPVARYGPFVMNTDEEIRQAISDYQNGRLATVKAEDRKY